LTLWNPRYIAEEYQALRFHFTSEKYDYFKFQGKIPKRWDKITDRLETKAHKLKNHENPKNLMLACLSRDKHATFWDIADFGTKPYLAWKKINQSLSYSFMGDLKLLEDVGLKSAIEISEDHPHPRILKLFSGKKWTLETFTIFVYNTGCIEYLNKRLQGDILWDETYLQIRKYHPFIQYDPEKFKALIRSLNA
jgi:hypothetical protein